MKLKVESKTPEFTLYVELKNLSIVLNPLFKVVNRDVILPKELRDVYTSVLPSGNCFIKDNEKWEQLFSYGFKEGREPTDGAIVVSLADEPVNIELTKEQKDSNPDSVFELKTSKPTKKKAKAKKKTTT